MTRLRERDHVALDAPLPSALEVDFLVAVEANDVDDEADLRNQCLLRQRQVLKLRRHFAKVEIIQRGAARHFAALDCVEAITTNLPFSLRGHASVRKKQLVAAVRVNERQSLIRLAKGNILFALGADLVDLDRFMVLAAQRANDVRKHFLRRVAAKLIQRPKTTRRIAGLRPVGFPLSLCLPQVTLQTLLLLEEFQTINTNRGTVAYLRLPLSLLFVVSGFPIRIFGATPAQCRERRTSKRRPGS